jgi:C4-dicarboxylate-specific signal transduction histidine kinase
VEIAAGRDGDRAILRVSDNGMGIPAMSCRASGIGSFITKSRAERGLGLGLSLVKAVVFAHGGTVSVESEVGRGSTFTVQLNPLNL